MSLALAARLALRSLSNLAAGRPICVSFEVTHSCPADCLHCDKGGMKKRDEARLAPADYRRLAAELSPTVVQLSGGEPLTRPDLEEIARAVKAPGRPPLVLCVTNGWLLDERRFRTLLDAGVDLFSISLDFPDARHDAFRRLPGLYARLDALLPRLARAGGAERIALNTALTRANFAEIPALVANAERWGTRISFSAYSALRTGDRGLCIEDPEELALLARHFALLRREHARTGRVLNTPWILEHTLRFFRDGGHGGCRAGVRFLVVRPDGLVNGCSMHPGERFRTAAEAARGFTTRERCDGCYVAIRAGTERPLARLALDGVGTWRSLFAR